MALLLVLQKKFFRRFMNGRPGPWGVLAVTTFGVRTLWRWARRNEEVDYRTVLRPGETVVVSHTTATPVSAKRDARKARKDARRSTSRRAKRHAGTS